MQEQGLSNNIEILQKEAVELLKKLIAIPAFSKEEDERAGLFEIFLLSKQILYQRKKNNIWAQNKFFDAGKPTILLNSHLDTVKPNAAYTIDPFIPMEKDGKLHGLGSNDAGAPLVSLLAVFLNYYSSENLKYNLIFAGTAEEEISGTNGIELILPELPKIDFAIVGEPTQMQIAIAEKGLLVLDCMVNGKAGHAARDEGDNAINKAIKDLEWFSTFHFTKISETLGQVKLSVTMIQAGTQHNVIPAACNFTVDVRYTDAYSAEEILSTVKSHVGCEVTPRSFRLKPSSVSIEHPFVQAAIRLGRKTFGSNTLSDCALLPFPSMKIGPGDSARSHTADEFIYLNEIEEGIKMYIQLFDQLL